MSPFGLLAIAFICGIFIASFLNIPFFYVYAACAISLLIAFINVNKKYFTVFLLIAALLLGYLVYKNSVYLERKTGSSAAVKAITKSCFFIREKVDTIIFEYLPGNEAVLLSAMLLGKREGRYFSLRAAFVKTGTVHILAISGLHVGLIAFILYVALSALRINQKVAIPLAILFLALYAVITGSRVPVIRATIMMLIVLMGALFRRSPSAFNSLGFAAIVILLVNPTQVFSPSFQLSFTAVLSILYITPRVENFFKVDRFSQNNNFAFQVLRYTIRLFSVSIAAWMGVAPLVAYHFNIVSPVAIFGNLIVIPLTFFVIASSISFITFSFFIKPLALVFASAAAGIIQFLRFVVNKLSYLPFAYFKIESPPISVILVYYALVFIIFNYRKKCYNK